MLNEPALITLYCFAHGRFEIRYLGGDGWGIEYKFPEVITT